MPTHLMAWQQSINSATPTNVNNIVDDILTRSGATRYLVPKEYKFLRWALAVGTDLTRAYIQSPSMQVRRMLADIIPHRRGTELLTLAAPEIAHYPTPIELYESEELEVLASEDNVGASQVDVIACLGLAELPAPPSGDIRIVRATASVALSVRAWTTVAVTLDQSLEPGEYALVGFIPISANVLAARALIVGQNFRPGVPGIAGAEAAARQFDPGTYFSTMFYDMGRFDHLTIPQFQFFASVADATEVVIMFLVKVG